jgi:anaphase-promoting complex subunit 1
LFLGGGCLTFATNNGAVAALLIALYPRFPTAPNDHRCHLQAFRHLYVLATEARCLQTVDVDTGLPVYAPIEMTIKESAFYSETTFCRVTPCILPERCSVCLFHFYCIYNCVFFTPVLGLHESHFLCIPIVG